MARPSKVDRLPPEIRDAIGELRRNGRTIDEILQHLRSLDLGEQIPRRSSLAEHIKKWDAVAARLHDSRAAAEAIMARIEDTSADNRIARFNVESLHANVMDLMSGENGEPVTLDPLDAMRISAVLKNLAAASRSDQSRYMEMKAMLDVEKAKAAKVLQAADDAVKAAGAGGDVDGLELIRKIREDIYGIYD